MIRTIALTALTAVAALAVTAPAQAAGVRIALQGKSPAQVEAEVGQAARTVCFRATRNETLIVDAYARCVKATTKASMDNFALAQANANSTVAAR
ncbi:MULTISPECIES: hypothetical protein [Phenylobacterium]|uniref:UrcA family protein n=1 Tax=Phenylobacterium koreense TaxID=266125 RepID=A0ABV2ENH3_9CAUL